MKSNSWSMTETVRTVPVPKCSGISGRQSGKWHEPVREFYESGVPNNPGRGEARQSVLVALNHFCPEILNTLAERCLRDEFLHLLGAANPIGQTGRMSCNGDMWVALIFLLYVVPLKAAIEDWASDTR